MRWELIEEGLWYLSCPDQEGDDGVLAWVSRRDQHFRWVCLGRAGRCELLTTAKMEAEATLKLLKASQESLKLLALESTAA